MTVLRSRSHQVPARLERRGRVRVRPREGHQRGRRRPDLVVEGRAPLDDQDAAAQPQAVRPQADGRVVRRQHARHRLPGHLLLPAPLRRAGRRVGRPPRADEGDVREARHPRGRAPVPRRRHRPVRVRGRLPPQPRRAGQAGDPVLRHGHRPARVPRPGQAVLRHRSSRPATTSSPPSTRRCGPAARSSTSRRASSARCRCRPTSGSTRRTPASSSAR